MQKVDIVAHRPGGDREDTGLGLRCNLHTVVRTRARSNMEEFSLAVAQRAPHIRVHSFVDVVVVGFVNTTYRKG